MHLAKLKKANKNNPYVARLTHQYNRATPVQKYSVRGTRLSGGAVGTLLRQEEGILSDRLSPEEQVKVDRLGAYNEGDYTGLVSNIMAILSADELDRALKIIQQDMVTESYPQQAALSDEDAQLGLEVAMPTSGDEEMVQAVEEAKQDVARSIAEIHPGLITVANDMHLNRVDPEGEAERSTLRLGEEASELVENYDVEQARAPGDKKAEKEAMKAQKEAEKQAMKARQKAEREATKGVRKARKARDAQMKAMRKSRSREMMPRKGDKALDQEMMREQQELRELEQRKASIAQRKAYMVPRMAQHKAQLEANLSAISVKRAEKEAKKAEKEAEKQAKQAQKEAAKQAKQAQKEAEKQAKQETKVDEEDLSDEEQQFLDALDGANQQVRDIGQLPSVPATAEEAIAQISQPSPTPTPAPQPSPAPKSAAETVQLMVEEIRSAGPMVSARSEAAKSVASRATTAQREVLGRQLKNIFKKMKEHKGKGDDEIDVLVAEYMAQSALCAQANEDGEDVAVGCAEFTGHGRTVLAPEDPDFGRLIGKAEVGQDRTATRDLAVWWARYNSGISKKDATTLSKGVKGKDQLFHLVEGTARHRPNSDCVYGVRKSGPLDTTGRHLCKKAPGPKSRSRSRSKSLKKALKAQKKASKAAAKAYKKRCKNGVRTTGPLIQSGPNKGLRRCKGWPRTRSRSVPARSARSPSRR